MSNKHAGPRKPGYATILCLLSFFSYPLVQTTTPQTTPTYSDCLSGFWDANNSTGARDCQACPVGFLCDDNIKTLCPANYWCTDNIQNECLPTLISVPGSSSETDCGCAENYRLVTPQCPTGYIGYPGTFRCYKGMEDEGRIHFQAVNNLCRNEGATMPGFMTSTGEMDFIERIVSYCGDGSTYNCEYWLNAYYQNSLSRLNWVDYFVGITPNQVLDDIDYAGMGMVHTGTPTTVLYQTVSGQYRFASNSQTKTRYARCMKPKLLPVCLPVPLSCDAETNNTECDSALISCPSGWYTDALGKCKECGTHDIFCSTNGNSQTCTTDCPIAGQGITNNVCNATHDAMCETCGLGMYAEWDTTPCQSPWISNPTNTKCYLDVNYLDGSTGLYEEAQAICAAYDSYLPELPTNSEADWFFQEFVPSNTYTRVLGATKNENGEFVWPSTGERIQLQSEGGCLNPWKNDEYDDLRIVVSYSCQFGVFDNPTQGRVVCSKPSGRYEKCTVCPENTFCMYGFKYDCPSNSVSQAGSSDPQACNCLAGFWDANNNTNGRDCQPCPEGYICNDNMKTLCPANFWCTADTQHECYPTFLSAPGSSASTDCVCDENYMLQTSECPTEYVEYPGSFRCYKNMGSNLNLIHATTLCSDDGATLPALMTSRQEMDFVSELHPNCPSYTPHCDYWPNAFRENGIVYWIDYYVSLTPNSLLDAVDLTALGLGSTYYTQNTLLYSYTGRRFNGNGWTNAKFVRCMKPKPLPVCIPAPSPCDAGTYGTMATGCNICDPGFYCPGGSTKIQCPNNTLTEPLYGAYSVNDCQVAVCGNFHQEADEECDNGPNNGDGCSDTCEFEDSTGTTAGPEWVCVTPESLATTSCCASVQNPISGEYVCDCKGVESNVVGITIRHDCSMKDIDECRVNHGGCNTAAMCLNHAATLQSNITHECICPPGMIGDGISRCDIYVYQVTFKVAVQGVSKYDVDENAIKDGFIENGVVPEDTPKEKIALHVTNYNGNFGNRRLLETGVEIEASIETDSSLEMEETVNTINTEAALTTISLSFGVDTNVALLQEPAESVVTMDQAFGTVNTVLTGFQVDSIAYDNTKFEWIIRARYIDDAPNVITSMYMSKTGQKPYTQDVRDTYTVAQHPCMQSSLVCCLNDYKESYTIGDFKQNITESIGSCTTDIANENTIGLFNPARNQELIDNMLSEYNNSFVKRINANTVDIHLYNVDLRDSLSMRNDLVGAYDMDFFLGMSYYTMLPAPVLATVASQTRIKATFTDSVAFATASKQSYTFLEYITVALYDTKLITDMVNVNHPQSVRMSFVVPAGLEQNMRTGLVPLTSIRYAIATTLPEPDDAIAWENPCRSSDGTGLWDTTIDGAPNPLYDLYNAAASQTCALQANMCTNPVKAEIRDRLLEFWFPIGDGTVSSAIFDSTQAYSIYIYFDISVIDSAGSSVRTKLFAQAALTELSMTMMCETLQLAAELKDVMDVSMAVGLVGTQSEWATTMKTHENILSMDTQLLDLSVGVPSPSIQNGLITLVVDGQDNSFTGPLSTNYRLEIDDLVSLHFLNDDTYEAAVQEFENGDAWTLDADATTGFLQIQIQNNLDQICYSDQIAGDMNCVIRRDISGRAIPNSYAVHPLATGMNTHDINLDSDWLQRHLLGFSESGDSLARNFTQIVRSRYNINDRYKKAWFINPGYPWSAKAGSSTQSILSLSDKTIMVAVVALDDGTGTTRRRMLLQVNTYNGKTTHSIQQIKDHPAGSVLPPIDNLLIDPQAQIAKAYGVFNKYTFLKFPNVETIAPAQASLESIRDTLQYRLRMKLGVFAPNATQAWIVQYLPHFKPKNTYRRRNLLQNAYSVEKTDTFVADLLVLLDFESYENLLYPQVLQDLFTASPDFTLVNITQVITQSYSAMMTDKEPQQREMYARVRDAVINLHAKDIDGQGIQDYNVPIRPTYGAFSASSQSKTASMILITLFTLISLFYM